MQARMFGGARTAPWLKLASLAACTALLVGCGPLKTLHASRSEFDADNDMTLPAEQDDAYLLEAADRFGLMALFAEVVYRRDLALRPQNLRDGRGCDHIASRQPPPRFGMPVGEGRAGWSRWAPTDLGGAAAPCFDQDGLYYETYVRADAEGRVVEAVVAFRGTENRSGQTWDDWRSNIAAALAFEPAQFKLARERLPALFDALQARYGRDGRRLPIYAVGHSLGGGLAQQAGYLSRDVRAVYTFNTSPVTNWSALRLRKGVKQGYPRIFRLYHGGEFLENVRFVTTATTQARFGRYDIGLQFKERTSISGHSMQLIACEFARLLAERKPERDAAHGYTYPFIAAHVVRSNQQPERRTRVCDLDDQAHPIGSDARSSGRSARQG